MTVKRLVRNTIFLVLFVSTNAMSQVVLHAANLPVVGDLWSNKTITDTTIQPGPSGAGQNWNFSNFFVYPSVVSEQFSSPNGMGNDALFPSSNLKATSLFGGADYYSLSSSMLEFQGLKNSSTEIIITNSQKIMSVPFAYGDVISNPAVTGIGLGYPLTGTILVTADGTGSLSLFTGAFTNTLRVFTDINLVLGAGSGVDTYIQIKKYTWYTSFYRAPVFQIAIFDINGPLGSNHQKITTVSLLTTGIEDVSNSTFNFSVLPNPASNNAEITVNLKKNSDVDFKISDIQGKVYMNENKKMIAGKNSFNIDLSDLPRGIYVISMHSDAINHNQRLVVE